MKKRIILIGPPGAGKTTLGKMLAKELDLQSIDTDAEIERQTGKKIGDIFIEEGESGFRKIEKRDCAQAFGGRKTS